MKYLEGFFTSIAWWTLRPDANLLAEQPGGNDPARYVSGSRSENGDLVVMYLPIGGKLRFKEGSLREGLQGEWFDPRTGQRMPSHSVEQGVFEAPDQQDWVLLLSHKRVGGGGPAASRSATAPAADWSHGAMPELAPR
jgi:hypothetical protein